MTNRMCNAVTNPVKNQLCDCQCPILVVDNDLTYREDHRFQLQKWGFLPIVAEGSGEALIEDAKQKARQKRCPLALLDMRLRDDNDPNDDSGLHLARALKPTRSIIVTAFDSVSVARRATGDYEAITLFGKEEAPEELRISICKGLEGFCQQTVAFTPPDWIAEYITPRLKSVYDQPIEADEIATLFSKLFPDAQTIYLEALASATDSTDQRASAIRNRSMVCRVRVADRQPVVVKLAATSWANAELDQTYRYRDRIWSEVERYKKHVEDRLGGRHYTPLRNYERLWNIGGIVYPFVQDAKTFSEFYQAGTPLNRLLKPLNHFFRVIWQEKYLDATPSTQTLFTLYDQTWNCTLRDQLVDWQKRPATRSFPGLTGSFPGSFPGSFADPCHWISRYKDASKFPYQQECIVHGDLHSDNFFVDHNDESWVIDFERTGKGHILTDFIELEQDLLTRLARFGDDELAIFYELVIALTQPTAVGDSMRSTERIDAHPQAYRALRTAEAIRKLAHEQTHFRDYREYYWGILLDSIFAYTKLIPSHQSGRQTRSLLLASILCKRLERPFDPIWPPKDWQPVHWTTLRQEPDKPLHFAHGYGLLIGGGETPSAPALSLPVTANDALALYETLVDPKGCAYLPEQLVLLTEGSATLAKIREALQQLAKQAQDDPDMTAIVYFSGQGIKQRGVQRYGLVPFDVPSNPNDGPLLDRSILWDEEFCERIAAIPAKRMLILLDLSHATGQKGERWLNTFDKAAPPESFLTLLRKGQGRVVISACRPDQKSYLLSKHERSIFTHHLIEALTGANNKASDEEVRISNLIQHLGKSVSQTVHSLYPGKKQIPWLDPKSEDFAIALHRARKE